MIYNKMNATVTGTTCDGEDFTEELQFEMIPPNENESYYGTGYYMMVRRSISGKQLVDVRYERTTDIEILADRFIKNWYGNNAKEIIKSF